jgi:hypothetical protein
MDIREKVSAQEFLAYNAKLQQKKHDLRVLLGEKGILKREGENKFDKYKYFSEAQYKLLFTELFTRANLELAFNELEYLTYEGSEKQNNGRMPRIEFKLIDTETGFYETSVITGEGMDKGDKAGYKAYTGALKYYLASTFLVATGDEAETESPDERARFERRPSAPAQAANTAAAPEFKPATVYQKTTIRRMLTPEQIGKAEKKYGLEFANLTFDEAAKIIKRLTPAQDEQEGA